MPLILTAWDESWEPHAYLPKPEDLEWHQENDPRALLEVTDEEWKTYTRLQKQMERWMAMSRDFDDRRRAQTGERR